MEFQDLMVVEFDIANHTFKSLSFDELNLSHPDKNLIYWVHCNLNNKNILKELAAKITLPETVIDLCKNQEQMSTMIDTDEDLTVLVQPLNQDADRSQSELSFDTLIIHLTHQYCLTASFGTLPVLTEFTNSLRKAIRFSKTPCFVLFLMLDLIVNEYSKKLFDYEVKTEEIDIEVTKNQENIYAEVLFLKQQAMKIKRNSVSIREILLRISSRKIAVISEACRLSLYNLSNHIHIVVHEADSIRDLLNSLLGQIDNLLMQKMNETMRVLTAFAAIFLPLSLITGIYGMNFSWIPETHWKYGYFFALGLILVCGFGLFFYFKRKKWF